MTPEAQLIAIAESCGAKIIKKTFRWGSGKRVGKKWAWNGNENTPCQHPGGGFFGFGWNEEASVSELPDYLNDLNAMHEAEKVLTDEQWSIYLSFLTKKDQKTLTQTWRPAVSATSAQRAEAFLRTLGRWEE